MIGQRNSQLRERFLQVFKLVENMMKKSDKRTTQTSLMVMGACLVLLIGAPNIGLAHDGDSSTEPRILLFRVLPATIEGEQWHELYWEVANTDSVQLIKDGKEIPGRTQLSDGSIGWPLAMSGSLRMKLKKLATFELIAKNRSGQSVRKTFTVEGPFSGSPTKPPAQKPEDSTSPKINSFRVSPATPEPGGSITFYWQVENEETIRLYEGNHEIDLRGMDARKMGEVGAFSTTIDETTTFRLEVIGRSRQATSRTFTVQVSESALPAAGTCAIWGQLQGRWRQEIRETPTGPTSTWTVPVNGYAAGSERPVANALVGNSGIYRFEELAAGKDYQVRPSWQSSPRQGTVSCGPGETRQGPTFTISSGPVID